jgi:hypothetical protein
MPRQFRLRSLFYLTAIVAVGCWALPTIRPQLATVAATIPFILAQVATVLVGLVHHWRLRPLVARSTAPVHTD